MKTKPSFRAPLTKAASSVNKNRGGIDSALGGIAFCSASVIFHMKKMHSSGRHLVFRAMKTEDLESAHSLLTPSGPRKEHLPQRRSHGPGTRPPGHCSQREAGDTRRGWAGRQQGPGKRAMSTLAAGPHLGRRPGRRGCPRPSRAPRCGTRQAGSGTPGCRLLWAANGAEVSGGQDAPGGPPA